MSTDRWNGDVPHAYRLEFHGGPRDGEVLPLDEPPDQEEFVDDGYWVEDMIVPLHRAVPNGRPLGWAPVEDDE